MFFNGIKYRNTEYKYTDSYFSSLQKTSVTNTKFLDIWRPTAFLFFQIQIKELSSIVTVLAELQ